MRLTGRPVKFLEGVAKTNVRAAGTKAAGEEQAFEFATPVVSVICVLFVSCVRFVFLIHLSRMVIARGMPEAEKNVFHGALSAKKMRIYWGFCGSCWKKYRGGRTIPGL